MPFSTPVALHIFNRPQYSNQVFAAIAQAQPSTLFIVADGPRADVPEDDDLCQQARAIVDQVDWECEVFTRFAESNLGGRCCNVQGLDWVFSQVEEAIILEDDCLPHPSFFPFCQAMLAQYRHQSQVKTISGSNFLRDTLSIPQTYVFSKFFVSWGWASWRRAWQDNDLKMTGWHQFKQTQPQFFEQQALTDWVTQLFDWAYQSQQVWDIPWFYSCLVQDGLTVVPKVNLISNIGTQGSHTQGNQGLNELPTFNLNLDAMIHPDSMVPNPLFEALIYKLFTANEPQPPQPLLKKLRSKLKKLLPRDQR